MENIQQYIAQAITDGIISSAALDPLRIEKTKHILDEANYIFNEALQDHDLSLEKKIDKGIVDPKTISGARVQERFQGRTYERPLIDLVQQGGGMFGIALLGYSYIMEKVGIRFYSHGGTSAGAINATFLASISPSIYEQSSIFTEPGTIQQATKSEVLTHIISNTDFSTFMERDGVVGWLQRKLFRNMKSFGLKAILIGFVSIFLVGIYGSFGIVFNTDNGLSGLEIRIFDFIIGSLNIVALFVFIYILFVKVLKDTYGINTGRVFYRWADRLLAGLSIASTKDLYKRMQEVRFDTMTVTDVPRLVLISSNLTHHRIVKFPENANDYWTNYLAVKPAAYLRATMSLPFIFETFVPQTRHYHRDTSNTRLSNAPKNAVKLEARFVDGGMLSNFPIREFHRTDGGVPRFPTFGVLLSNMGLNDTEQQQRKKSRKVGRLSLLKYLGTYVATFRNFYDFDFIFGNDEIKKRVVTVDTSGFNWLDFWMTDQTKKELFKVGVYAAIDQLDKFDWESYKRLRS